MLKRIGEPATTENARVAIGGASFPAPFKEGLEYSSPARGTWNIVHTGMLIPESHMVFVCALGCLRGVVLTAAEMNALDRYSAVQIREENVLDGGMEELMVEGVSDVIAKLRKRPRVIEIFISCQHFFMGYDQRAVYAALGERFPDIHFLDCYMIPTLRKSGVTPDQKMRIQLYALWEGRPVNPKKVNLIGSNLKTSPTSELVRMVEDAGYEFWDLYRCKDFEDYMDMAGAALNLVYEPVAQKAAESLKKRLGMEYLYLSFTYDFDGLEENYARLAAALGIKKPDFSVEREAVNTAVARAKEIIGDAPIAVDYSFTFRILNFAKFLLERGFNVTTIYADAFCPEDEEDFSWIREHFPEITVSATNKPEMRFLHYGGSNLCDAATGKTDSADRLDENVFEKTAIAAQDGNMDTAEDENQKILAVGQKAAYFEATDYFVNVAESGGFYGYDGIRQVMELMADAFLNKKDRRTLIQRKGYGCESCL